MMDAVDLTHIWFSDEDVETIKLNIRVTDASAIGGPLFPDAMGAHFYVEFDTSHMPRVNPDVGQWTARADYSDSWSFRVAEEGNQSQTVDGNADLTASVISFTIPRELLQDPPMNSTLSPFYAIAWIQERTAGVDGPIDHCAEPAIGHVLQFGPAESEGNETQTPEPGTARPGSETPSIALPVLATILVCVTIARRKTP